MTFHAIRIGLWEIIPSVRLSLCPSANTATLTLSWLCYALYVGIHRK